MNAEQHQTEIVSRFKTALTEQFMTEVLGAKNLKSSLDNQNNVILTFETKLKRFNKVRVYVLYRTNTVQMHLEKWNGNVCTPVKYLSCKIDSIYAIFKNYLDNLK